MSKRKTGLDYKNDMTNLKLKLAKLHAETTQRLSTLCKQYPDAVISNNVKANDIVMHINTMTPDVQIQHIIAIEKWLVDQHPHKQKQIDFPN